MTVRDLTYEVRRACQIADGAPGVIVSDVERGGKGAVAGIRPYEILLTVNDAPMASVKDLRAAIAPGGEFRLELKRMDRGRIVKLALDKAGGR